MGVPVPLAGALTIIVLVVFGVFVYPWLLARRGGLMVVALITAALGVLFYYFDASTGTPPATSAGLAVIWAALPLIIGLVIRRFQSKPVSGR